MHRIADLFEVDRSAFEARLPAYPEALGVGLSRHGVVNRPSEVTVSNLAEVIEAFQAVTRDGTRRWRVWARADGGETRTLEAVLHRPGRIEVVTITAKVIDLTELMAAHGFSIIGQRSCFPRNYLCAEWWHFQYNRALTQQVLQFGAELLSLAMSTEDFLDNQTDISNEPKRVFRGKGRHRWGITPGGPIVGSDPPWPPCYRFGRRSQWHTDREPCRGSATRRS